MQVHFHGAAGEVTGSMHLVEAAGRRILLDCGLIQGSRESEARNEHPFPFDPSTLDAVVLSHAHIDHVGRGTVMNTQGYHLDEAAYRGDSARRKAAPVSWSSIPPKTRLRVSTISSAPMRPRFDSFSVRAVNPEMSANRAAPSGPR